MKHEWKFIDVADIGCVDNSIGINVTHVRDLALQTTTQRLFATAHNDVGLNSAGTKLRNAVLGWLGLLLAARADERNKRHVQVANVVSTRLVAELTNCLKERKNLNVSNGSAHFSNDYIGVVCGDSTDSALDFICDVRNYLNSFSQIITTTFGS